MRNLLLAGAIALPAMLATMQPVRAIYEGPWCAMVPLGDESMAERCDMRDLDMCRREIFGQGGFCTPNPLYRQSEAAQPKTKATRPR